MAGVGDGMEAQPVGNETETKDSNCIVSRFVPTANLIPGQIQT